MATQPEVPTTGDNGGYDFGTDAELRPLIESQATPPPYDQKLVDAFVEESRAAATASYDAGVGMNDDEVSALFGKNLGADPNAPKTVTAAYSPTDLFSQQINPQPNVLDNFSSYTYRASLYVMSPQQYTQLMLSHKKTVNGYQLLIQSGGAPTNTGGFQAGLAPTFAESNGQTSTSATGIPTANQPDAGRNPAFPNDFYFDSITVENRLIGSETQASHSATSLKFTIIEPNGITLIDRLYQAVQDYMSKDGKSPVNYTAVTYLMVIRFYGYDAAGNLTTGIGPPGTTTDPGSVVEKFIPFRINGIQWSVQNKLVQYNFDCTTTNLIVGSGTRRGTVPYDIQLSASSVAELLGGGASYSTATGNPATPGASTSALQAERDDAAAVDAAAAKAPPNASAAPSSKTTIRQGLMGAMNEFQQKLVEQGIYEQADEYDIVFVKGAEKIASAKIVPPGTKVESKLSPMAKAPTQSADSLLMSKVSKDTSVRNWSVTAGMQLVQAIELAIRNSTYILNQQLVQDDPTTDAVINNPGADGKPVTWFQISFKAVPKLPIDKLRNDYAYKITFEISPYRIENYNSKYFPVNKFRGLHKSYQYWFTGKNTAVLDYQETMNNLYTITVTGTDPANSQAEMQRRLLTSSMREIPFYNFQAASTESRQGTEGKAFEGASNLAEVLYDPQGLAHAKLKIVGDPAWLQQGSFAGGVNEKEFDYNAFLPDGTINFDASQILFEIAWQRPQDYNLQTGLADPYSNSSSSPRMPLQSRVYTATKVVSEFAHGKFEQTLEGQLYFYVKPDATNKAVGTSPPGADQTEATAQRTGVNLSNASAGAGRGVSQAAALAKSRGQSGAKTLPAGVDNGAQASTSNGSNETQSNPQDQVQPSPPPDAPTSGSGQQLSWYDSDAVPPPATLDRITVAGLEQAPEAPQDISREA